MRTLIRFAVLLLAAAGLMPASGRAQNKDDQVRARGVHYEYENDKSDGMRVWVYKIEGDRLIPVDTNHVFVAGDRARIEFESNFDGYAYVLNVEPTGKKRVLFPRATAANVNNKIQAHQRYMVPFQGWFKFDEQKGREIIEVIMLRQPIAYLDDAVKNSGGELGETASNAAAELSENAAKPAGNVESPTKASPATGNSGLRARDFKLEPGKDNDEKGMTGIAIPDPKPKAQEPRNDGKLKGGDYVVVQLLLQHN